MNSNLCFEVTVCVFSSARLKHHRLSIFAVYYLAENSKSAIAFFCNLIQTMHLIELRITWRQINLDSDL